MGWVEKRLNQLGVPTKNISASSIGDYDVYYAAMFLKAKKNLLVIGSQYYQKCIRLMRLRLLADRSLNLKWQSQSQLNYNSEAEGVDILALVQLYEEENNSKKNLAGNMVNEVLSGGGQVLIGCKSAEILEGAFPYDVDMIETEFEVWKGKDYE